MSTSTSLLSADDYNKRLAEIRQAHVLHKDSEKLSHYTSFANDLLNTMFNAPNEEGFDELRMVWKALLLDLYPIDPELCADLIKKAVNRRLDALESLESAPIEEEYFELSDEFEIVEQLLTKCEIKQIKILENANKMNFTKELIDETQKEMIRLRDDIKKYYDILSAIKNDNRCVNLTKALYEYILFFDSDLVCIVYNSAIINCDETNNKFPSPENFRYVPDAFQMLSDISSLLKRIGHTLQLNCRDEDLRSKLKIQGDKFKRLYMTTVTQIVDADDVLIQNINEFCDKSQKDCTRSIDGQKYIDYLKQAYLYWDGFLRIPECDLGELGIKKEWKKRHDQFMNQIEPLKQRLLLITFSYMRLFTANRGMIYLGEKIKNANTALNEERSVDYINENITTLTKVEMLLEWHLIFIHAREILKDKEPEMMTKFIDEDLMETITRLVSHCYDIKNRLNVKKNKLLMQ